MLAVATMDPAAQTVFYAIAVLLFALTAFAVRVPLAVNGVALGLAFFAFPFFWNALAAT
jgi:hypothetical protein